MAENDQKADRTLEMAARVAEILDEVGVASAVIGAAALAAWGYPRATEDIDLAVATDPFSALREAERRIATQLSADVRLVMPDADDPLGGVLTVTGEGFDPVQVVNFTNPFGGPKNPGSEAVAHAAPGLVSGTCLRVVTVPYLVALKLYAGGYKSRLDVLELLSRNPQALRDEIGEVCRRFGLDPAWQEILEELQD